MSSRVVGNSGGLHSLTPWALERRDDGKWAHVYTYRGANARRRAHMDVDRLNREQPDETHRARPMGVSHA